MNYVTIFRPSFSNICPQIGQSGRVFCTPSPLRDIWGVYTSSPRRVCAQNSSRASDKSFPPSRASSFPSLRRPVPQLWGLRTRRLFFSVGSGYYFFTTAKLPPLTSNICGKCAPDDKKYITRSIKFRRQDAKIAL